MSINPMDIAIHIINIVVLYVMLKALLYKPVSKFMAERTARVENQLAAARENEEKAEALKVQYEKQLAGANDEVQGILREANQRASESAAHILYTAREQGSGMLSEAREKIEQQKEEYLASIEKDIAELSISLAEEILKREVRYEDNATMIDSFFDRWDAS